MKRFLCLLLSLFLVCGALASCESAKNDKKYTLTFETNGGSAINAIKVRAGDSITPPAAPTKEGYVFLGWYEDEELFEEFVFDEMPEEDITLYAKWKRADADKNDGDTNDGDTNDGDTNDGDKNDGDKNDGDGLRGEDGSWEKIDFDGQTVRVALSVNQNDECRFPAADVYTKGPDNPGSHEVHKEVVERNDRAKTELGIQIEYVETDIPSAEIHSDIRRIVQTTAKNSPDVYTNDLCGLSRAMIDGLLWNVKNSGADVANYFDFEADGFYTEFMKGLTFDQEKQYLFAGDYHIDMIRMAWVVFVNNELLNNNLAKLPVWCDSEDSFYTFVDDGFWDMDILTEMAARVYVDSGYMGVTEITDHTVGLAINSKTADVLSSASGITLYYQDVTDGYEPKILSDISDYQKVANKYIDMVYTMGVYYEETPASSTEYFVEGNVLFAFSRLGEMESHLFRDCVVSKGLVPVPKWDADEQDVYRTLVDSEAEISCILNTSGAFSAATALMQFLNEESNGVIMSYYEKGFKYKYNDHTYTRKMMDLVRETLASPFGDSIGVLCHDFYTGVGVLSGLSLADARTVSSTFAAERDAYVDCMNKLLDRVARHD